MSSEKKNAHMWVRQNAVKIGFISISVRENNKQYVFYFTFIILYFSCLPLVFAKVVQQEKKMLST